MVNLVDTNSRKSNNGNKEDMIRSDINKKNVECKDEERR